jgi:hypothetical protein
VKKVKPSHRQYPYWICFDCGHASIGHRKPGVVTCHSNICGICGEQKSVCNVRDFGYPVFMVEDDWKLHSSIDYSKPEIRKDGEVSQDD